MNAQNYFKCLVLLKNVTADRCCVTFLGNLDVLGFFPLL